MAHSVVTLAAGVGFGALAAVLVARFMYVEPAVPRTSASAVAHERQGKPQGRTQVATRERGTEPSAPQAPSSSAPPARNTAAAPTIPTPRTREAREQAYLKRVEEYRREPVDTSWGPAATRTLRRDMHAAVLGSAEQPGISGRLIDVTCATTTCFADLEWKSWDAAREEWRNLMHYPYEPNCAREILLPEPTAADSSAPYRGTMLFNCERARIQASTSEPNNQ